jgi:branched-chain amino acid transport system ATP-binding protein
LSLLTVEDVHLHYGRSHIIQGVSLEVGEGEVVALLGRNGAGKTSLVQGILGLHALSGGSVRLGGVELRGQPAHRVARRGVSYVPQGRGVFSRLTVDENLRIGEFLARGSSLRQSLLEIFPVLRERRSQRAGTLSGGEQQMLATARALLASPRLLLMDEPTEGLAPIAIDTIREALGRLFDQLKLSVLLVEQNLDFSFALASRAYVMEKGRIVASAPVAKMGEQSLAQHLTF